MQSGFTFKNRHSREFGIVAKTKARSLLPDAKSYTYDTPLMDGAYDMTEANAYGRTFYKDRVFEIDMQISGDNLAELERKAARTASWLTGGGKLIFDDSSAVSWDARCISNVTFAPERRGKTAVLSVIFSAGAIGLATFGAADGITLGDAVSLDSDIPLDMSGYFEKQLVGGENTVRVVNIGDFYIRPSFEFIGDTENITVKYGDTKILLEALTESVNIIDLEKCNVTDGNGNSILEKMQGDFFELPSGASELMIYTSAPCVLKIDYIPKTIYDFDFSEIDWGDADA